MAHQTPPGSVSPVPAAPAGTAIAGFERRAGALILDWFLLAFVAAALGVAFHIPGIQSTTTTVAGAASTQYSVTNTGPVQVVFAIVSLLYAVGFWMSTGATLGQRALGLHVYRASDPRTLAVDMAATRWAALWGVPCGLGALGGMAPGAATVLGLLQFAWIAVLIVTTLRSPTKQGFHDRLAESVVVH